MSLANDLAFPNVFARNVSCPLCQITNWAQCLCPQSSGPEFV